MKKLTVLFVFLCITFLSIAQNRQIKGVVKDDAGIPVQGITVLPKGSKSGTQTDKDGNFSIVAEGTGKTAEAAYQSVLNHVGASLRRDTLDERIINDVKNRAVFIIDVQERYPHHSPYEITVNAWPVLKSLPAPTDTDKDGIPDDWEKKNGLNANDATDASKISLNEYYSNIEVYINSLK